MQNLLSRISQSGVASGGEKKQLVKIAEPRRTIRRTTQKFSASFRVGPPAGGPGSA